jgi:hypothetical protein
VDSVNRYFRSPYVFDRTHSRPPHRLATSDREQLCRGSIKYRDEEIAVKLFERSRWLMLALFICAAACDRTDELVNGTGKSRLVGTSTSAQAVIDDCKQAYQRLSSYEDNAFARLTYNTNGVPTEDRAPLSVAFERPGMLGIRAYAVEAGPTDGRWYMRLADAEQSTVAGQVISRAIPQRADFSWLLSDPIVGDELAAGLAGFPPQLDLLLSTDPMRGLVDESSLLTLLSPETLQGSACDVVQVTRGGAEFRLWIDKSTKLLRRLQLPNTNLSPEMLADKNISQVTLTIEFAAARTNEAVNWERFKVPVAKDTKLVTRFVPAPPVLPTDRIGAKVPAFRLVEPQGTGAFSTADVRSGNITVLLWLADHPACRAAAQQMAQVAQAIESSAINRRIQFVSVWAEPQSASGTTFDTLAAAWGLPGQLVVDKEAVGRDLFGISDAPTLVVLDDGNRVQILEERSNPYLVELLPDLLNRIVQGDDLSAEVLRTAAVEQKRHRAELWMSAAINADRNSFAAPESYPPRMIELKELSTDTQRARKSAIVAMNVDSAYLCWTLTSDGELRREAPAALGHNSAAPSPAQKTVAQTQQSFQTQWQIDPNKRSRLEVSPDGQFIAFAQQPSASVDLFDTTTGQNRNIQLGAAQKIVDLQWLSLAGAKSPRLAVVTSDNETKLLDPHNHEQLSGRCPAEPMALVSKSVNDTLIGGYVVLADRGVEQLMLSGDSAFRTKQSLGRPASHAREIADAESEPNKTNLPRKVAFQPAAGPWKTIQYQRVGENQPSTSILARGWIAQDEPGVFMLDEQLQQQWHYRLPITTNKDAWIIASACVDPASGQPTWVISQSNEIVHVLRGDGGITDSFRLDEPVVGLGLVPQRRAPVAVRCPVAAIAAVLYRRVAINGHLTNRQAVVLETRID